MGHFFNAMIILTMVMFAVSIGSSGFCTTEFDRWQNTTYGNYTTGNVTANRPGIGATPQSLINLIVSSWWGGGGALTVIGAAILAPNALPMVVAGYIGLVMTNLFLLPTACIGTAALPASISIIVNGLMLLMVGIGFISIILGDR